jgi:hypothetical protein
MMGKGLWDTEKGAHGRSSPVPPAVCGVDDGKVDRMLYWHIRHVPVREYMGGVWGSYDRSQVVNDCVGEKKS